MTTLFINLGVLLHGGEYADILGPNDPGIIVVIIGNLRAKPINFLGSDELDPLAILKGKIDPYIGVCIYPRK